MSPDPRYHDILVTRFVNNLMKRGKRQVAYKTFYYALDSISKKAGEAGLTPIEYWKKAIENITPSVEVKSRRVGGATFQVPMEVRPDRKIAISIKNMIFFARKRGGKSMPEKLAAEIISAFNSEGGAFKKKEDMHKMAEANKAFSHFRF